MAMTYLTKLKPEPMGEYSLSTAYGVNSLVMSEDGAAAYISVKDVPAGTPLTNTEYWKIHTDLTAVKQSAEAAAQKANAARDEMLEIARNLTDMVEKSGNPVQAELVGGLPFDRAATALSPIQSGSGDPSPSNIRPISGWTGAKLTRCGKNMMDLSQGYGYDVLKPLNVPAGMSITFSLFPTNGTSQLNERIIYEDGTEDNFAIIGKNVDNNIWYTKTTTPNKQIKEYSLYNTESSNNRTISKGMIEYGSTATAYEPYQGNTYTAEFGQTVYGGTLDWNTGVLTVDKAFVEYDGSADENWRTQVTVTSGYRIFRILPGDAEPNTGASNVAYAVSNMYKAVSPNGAYLKTTGICVNQNELMIYDADRATLTVDGWKAWLSEHPVQIVYKLATPTTIQLTPQEIKQLQGVNTLYGDGSISMTGRADKALALEARIAALEAAG